MDARLMRLALIVSVLCSLGATYKSENFEVTAPTAEFAKQVGDLAEHYRDEIAVEWLGHKLPKWYKPCPIQVKVGQIGAGGATSFAFDRDQSGEMQVFGWRMNVQGSEERILDSVLPHEISHTVFACYFRRPLPRWADEGAATLVEHESERNRQVLLLNQVLKSGRRIPLRKLLAIKEYPSDMHSVMTLYAEGYSLADFLVQAGGRTRYLKFLDDAHRDGWDKAIAANYELGDVSDLEERWTGWVMAGSPRFNLPEGSQLADAREPQRGAVPAGFVVRGQSPESEAAAQPPQGTALASSTPRGGDLTAPEPRKSQTTGLPADTQLADATGEEPDWNDNRVSASGREQALAEGWMPVPGDRPERSGPQAGRWTLPTASEETASEPYWSESDEPQAPVFQPTDVDEVLDGRRRIDFSTNAAASSERNVPGRASSWSEFPQADVSR